MDCCNYMQYRQQYYGSQYYEPAMYDFYGQQNYQDYYGHSQYYQQWHCANNFTDYVYNPKEARIRKAMRDATRERSIGTSPMLQRPNARRVNPHGWVQSPHEEMMMGMSPNCGYSSNEAFLGTYGKMGAGTAPPPTSNYMQDVRLQSNPLAQLQQQTDMWPEYHHRPQTTGAFMMNETPSYPTPPPILEPKPPQNQKENSRFLYEPNETDKKQVSFPGAKPNEVSIKPTKPLPDFNEAFGSTERGRFQSPPDPYFFDSIKFDDYQM